MSKTARRKEEADRLAQVRGTIKSITSTKSKSDDGEVIKETVEEVVTEIEPGDKILVTDNVAVEASEEADAVKVSVSEKKTTKKKTAEMLLSERIDLLSEQIDLVTENQIKMSQILDNLMSSSESDSKKVEVETTSTKEQTKVQTKVQSQKLSSNEQGSIVNIDGDFCTPRRVYCPKDWKNNCYGLPMLDYFGAKQVGNDTMLILWGWVPINEERVVRLLEPDEVCKYVK